MFGCHVTFVHRKLEFFFWIELMIIQVMSMYRVLFYWKFLLTEFCNSLIISDNIYINVHTHSVSPF